MLEARRAVGVEERVHRLAHRRSLKRPDLRVGQELQPLELGARELFVRAALAPVLVRIRAVAPWVEERLVHHVDRAWDLGLHELRIRVVPRDDRIEPLVEVDVWIHGVKSDTMAQLAQTLDRPLAVCRREVVENRACHQKPGRPRLLVRLHLRNGERRVERQVDVVPQDHVTGLRGTVKPCELVAAEICRAHELAVVGEIERAIHLRARIHWNCTGPSGSVIETTSSRSIMKPPSPTSSVLTAGAKLEKNDGSPRKSPNHSASSPVPNAASSQPGEASHEWIRVSSGASSSRGT